MKLFQIPSLLSEIGLPTSGTLIFAIVSSHASPYFLELEYYSHLYSYYHSIPIRIR